MVIDILFLCAGLYLLIVNFRMKSTNEISSQLVGKKTDLSKARDKEGYIKAMFPKNLIFSIILIVASVLGIVSNYFAFSVWIQAVIFVAYIGGIIYYSTVSVNCQKKYLV